jgi:hypothetical protein
MDFELAVRRFLGTSCAICIKALRPMTRSGLRFLFRACSGLWISMEQALFFLASFRVFRATAALARAGARACERRARTGARIRARAYMRGSNPGTFGTLGTEHCLESVFDVPGCVPGWSGSKRFQSPMPLRLASACRQHGCAKAGVRGWCEEHRPAASCRIQRAASPLSAELRRLLSLRLVETALD